MIGRKPGSFVTMCVQLSVKHNPMKPINLFDRLQAIYIL